MSVFLFNEHEGLCDTQRGEFNDFMSSDESLKLPTCAPNAKSIENVKYLGIFKEGEHPKAHYYIGASWFVKNECAFVVKPKVDVDYIKLFMSALSMNSANEAEYFSNYYHIDFEEPAIETDSLNNVITPLLILHYISLLKHLVSKGLKKGYVVKEENLQSKVRGRILLQKHLTKNVFAKREDHVFCRFQEFTDDIPENRILKKALSFSVRFVNQFESFKGYLKELAPQLAGVSSAFENVSEDVTIAQVAKVNAGKIFRHYEAAIKVAKLILRHFDYSIDKVSEEKRCVQPFCIDMPRLYEMYVLNLLRKAYGDDIQFQVPGRCKTQVDFIKKSANEKLILDAKYKPRYDGGNAGIINDIREISGYARDKKILNALGWKYEQDSQNGDFLPKCVIIYPECVNLQKDESDDEKDDSCCEITEFSPEGILKSGNIKEIPTFKGFYKIAVALPSKKNG